MHGSGIATAAADRRSCVTTWRSSKDTPGLLMDTPCGDARSVVRSIGHRVRKIRVQRSGCGTVAEVLGDVLGAVVHAQGESPAGVRRDAAEVPGEALQSVA